MMTTPEGQQEPCPDEDWHARCGRSCLGGVLIVIDEECGMTPSEQWTAFLSGHWTRERPTRPGYYPTEGVACGQPEGVTPNKTIIAYDDHGQIRFTQSWGGWWWSEPLPMLPPPPDVYLTPTKD